MKNVRQKEKKKDNEIMAKGSEQKEVKVLTPFFIITI